MSHTPVEILGAVLRCYGKLPTNPVWVEQTTYDCNAVQDHTVGGEPSFCFAKDGRAVVIHPTALGNVVVYQKHAGTDHVAFVGPVGFDRALGIKSEYLTAEQVKSLFGLVVVGDDLDKAVVTKGQLVALKTLFFEAALAYTPKKEC